MSPRDSTQRLRDIIDAIDAIEAAGDSPDAAIRYHLVVIGEAVAGLDDVVRDAHPQIPWARIVGLRNELVHAYHRVDAERLQLVVGSHLEALRAVCEDALG